MNFLLLILVISLTCMTWQSDILPTFEAFAQQFHTFTMTERRVQFALDQNEELEIRDGATEAMIKHAFEEEVHDLFETVPKRLETARMARQKFPLLSI